MIKKSENDKEQTFEQFSHVSYTPKIKLGKVFSIDAKIFKIGWLD